MDPERELVLSYAPPGARAGLTALLALDDRLRGIVRAARDPTIGLMRLTWWGDALVRLDTVPPPAEPLLQELATAVLPQGVRGADLESLVDGWARLLDTEDIDLDLFAREVGEGLFGAACALLGKADARAVAAGRAWALARLAAERPALLGAARARVDAALAGAFQQPWPRALRALGALSLLARFNMADTPPGSPRRVARLLVHRLTGR